MMPKGKVKINGGPVQPLNVVTMPKNKESPPSMSNLFGRGNRTLTINEVKRGYSRLIRAFCAGEILGEDAKTLVYILSGYLSLIKDFELDARIADLEKNQRKYESDINKKED